MECVYFGQGPNILCSWKQLPTTLYSLTVLFALPKVLQDSNMFLLKSQHCLFSFWSWQISTWNVFAMNHKDLLMLKSFVNSKTIGTWWILQYFWAYASWFGASLMRDFECGLLVGDFIAVWLTWSNFLFHVCLFCLCLLCMTFILFLLFKVLLSH